MVWWVCQVDSFTAHSLTRVHMCMTTPGGLLLWADGSSRRYSFSFFLSFFLFSFFLFVWWWVCWRGVAWRVVCVLCFVVVLLFCSQTTYQTRLCVPARAFLLWCVWWLLTGCVCGGSLVACGFFEKYSIWFSKLFFVRARAFAGVLVVGAFCW